MENDLINILFLLISAVLVFFMQAGFAMLELGFTRAKNAVNIMMKNLMDFALGALVFFAIGFAFMFGSDVGGIIGVSGFFDPIGAASAFTGVPSSVFVLFQMMLCATSATIVSGAMAERTKFVSYLICSAVMSMIIYPVTGHWIWGGGWLSGMGFHDLAGSGAVHMVGGICAFVGAFLVGPRKGKYTKAGKSVAILGHNIPMSFLGTFILWLGWFGFNCGSAMTLTENAGMIAINNVMASSAGAVSAMIFTWILFKKPDASMVCNGVIAGLVSVTASADVIAPWAAVLIGAAAGILMTLSVEFLDKKVKVDDPVGAISVHGVCGLWGVVAAGIFGKGCDFFTQLVGVLAVLIYVMAAAFLVFGIVKKVIGLRVSESEEIDGLDIHEHNAIAYGNFRLHDDK